MRFLSLAILTMVMLAIAVALVLYAQFRGKVEAWRKVLAAGQVSGPPDQASIPPIMLAFALRNGGTLGGLALMVSQQADEMRLGPDQPFFAVAARQLSGTRDPGFIWEATATIARVVPIRVVDAHAGGKGWLEVRIAGAIPVANASGPESDRGEMMRFLSELAWNPDAILNVAALRWRQIDASTVEVSIETSGGTAIVRQLFDADDNIVGIEADDRPYLVGGKTVPTRWVGRFSDYVQFGSYRLPRHGEVAWALPEGEFVYFRGTISSFGPAAQ